VTFYIRLGSFFLLYDFLQHFNKDEPSDLKRETFVELINTIFDQFSSLQRESIIFQVCILLSSFGDV